MFSTCVEVTHTSAAIILVARELLAVVFLTYFAHLLALLFIRKIFLHGFLTANYYADFYRSPLTYIMYHGVLVVNVRNNYYKYVQYKYAGAHTYSSHNKSTCGQ